MSNDVTLTFTLVGGGTLSVRVDDDGPARRFMDRYDSGLWIYTNNVTGRVDIISRPHVMHLVIEPVQAPTKTADDVGEHRRSEDQ